MEKLLNSLNLSKEVKEILDFVLFDLGRNSKITLKEFALILFWIIFWYWVIKWTKRLLVDKLLLRITKEDSVISPVSNIIRAMIWSIAVIMILEAHGVELSGLKMLTGALGVGIGFGLQNITNNFISGIIIIFERPVNVGDSVEVGDIRGKVAHISIRATTILTNDNISIIVPNSYFVNNNVINWSLKDNLVRCHYPIPIPYGTDMNLVRRLLIEVATAHDSVEKEPKPDVWIKEFADNAIIVTLNVWTKEYIASPNNLKSKLYYLVIEKLTENNIKMPFPQREITLKKEQFSGEMPTQLMDM
ncbi:MAG: mechanosensitive ion channel family protein [Bacteroidia bacterium]